MLIYANYMTMSQRKMADDDVDDAVLAAASFFYMYDTVVKMMLATLNREKRVCRPCRFWIHDVIRGREMSIASVSVGIASSYRVGVSTVAGIIPETCDAVWSTLHPLYLPSPAKQDWLLEFSKLRWSSRWQVRCYQEPC
jgi:hypothetical protein